MKSLVAFLMVGFVLSPFAHAKENQANTKRKPAGCDFRAMAKDHISKRNGSVGVNAKINLGTGVAFPLGSGDSLNHAEKVILFYSLDDQDKPDHREAGAVVVDKAKCVVSTESSDLLFPERD